MQVGLKILIIIMLATNCLASSNNYHRSYTPQYKANEYNPHKTVVSNSLDKLDAILLKSNKRYSDHKTTLKYISSKELERKVDKKDKTWMNCAEFAYWTKRQAERLGFESEYIFEPEHVLLKVNDKGKVRYYSNGRRR